MLLRATPWRSRLDLGLSEFLETKALRPSFWCLWQDDGCRISRWFSSPAADLRECARGDPALWRAVSSVRPCGILTRALHVAGNGPQAGTRTSAVVFVCGTQRA